MCTREHRSAGTLTSCQGYRDLLVVVGKRLTSVWVSSHSCPAGRYAGDVESRPVWTRPQIYGLCGQRGGGSYERFAV